MLLPARSAWPTSQKTVGAGGLAQREEGPISEANFWKAAAESALPEITYNHPTVFARSITLGPTQNDLFWNWGAGESGSSASVTCLFLVRPPSGLCWNTPGGGEQESCPSPLPAPGPPTAQGLCWNTPAGERESCPGPLPALVHPLPGPLLEYACGESRVLPRSLARPLLGAPAGIRLHSPCL